MKTAEEVLNSKLDYKILILNNPDYTFNKVIEAMEEYARQFKTVEPEKREWLHFENNRPSIGQEIWIVWPIATIEPEWRKWTKQMDELDWSTMRWLPIPDYSPIPPTDNIDN